MIALADKAQQRLWSGALDFASLPEQGIAQGRAEERALLCRQAERKFDAATARRYRAPYERSRIPA